MSYAEAIQRALGRVADPARLGQRLRYRSAHGVEAEIVAIVHHQASRTEETEVGEYLVRELSLSLAIPDVTVDDAVILDGIEYNVTEAYWDGLAMWKVFAQHRLLRAARRRR